MTVTSTTQFLDRPGGRIAYDVTGGDGPLVVCVPGMGDVRRTYRFLIPALAEAGYRVATMDLRGQGDSSVGWDDYRPETIGADVLALIRHLGGPAIVIGHSFGPAPAIWAAAEAPDEITGIVLIAPFFTDVKLNPLLQLLAAVILRSARLWTLFYSSLYKLPKPADFRAYTRALRASFSEPGRLAALRALAAVSKAGANARIPEVRCPVLIIMGTRDPDHSDPVAVAREGERLFTAAAQVRVELVDGAGHYPHNEAPEITRAAILNFLGGVRA